MKRGALFLLCDSDSEREREREGESSWVSVSPVWDTQRPNEGDRKREREREQQGGWDNYTLFVHPGIRFLNAGMTAKRLSADAVFNENKKKKTPYLLLSDHLLFYSCN